MGIVENILKGEEKSAARLISLVEDGKKEAYESLSRLLPYTGKAHILGITGPAGAGKSTLTGRLAVAFAEQGKKVAVIATDPTSISGKGAFLGDRLRMKEAEEKHIFIRSMAHRGYPGGVAKAAMGAVYILEGLGKEIIILESTGAGQSEKELFYLCDTVVTLFTPDYGDDVQLMKAGLMEIGDVIVVNKADKPEALNALRELTMYSQTRSKGWTVPVVLTEANKGEGIDALIKAIEAHWQSIDSGEKRSIKKKKHTEAFILALLKDELWKRFSERLSVNDVFREIIDKVQAGKTDAYSAVEKILDNINIVEREQ